MKDYFKNQLQKIKEYYTIEKKDTKDFASFKIGTMKVKIEQYDVQGLGNICFIEASMFCILKMYSMVITPKEKDAVLYSIDYIKNIGKSILLIEEYDVLLEKSEDTNNLMALQNLIKNSYNRLSDKTIGSYWYDDIKLNTSIAKKSNNNYELIGLADKYLDSYLEYTKNIKKCDKSLKTKKCKEYASKLLKNGGPATDIFMKTLKEEKTQELFYKYVFGVEE